MKRAIRRKHLRRMKAKARKIYHWCTHPEKYANNLATCSCPGCCNWRLTEGPTRRELVDWERDWDV